MKISKAGALALGLVLVLPQANAASEYEKWKLQQQQSFQEYKDKRDKEFTEFLQTQWKEMQLLKGFVRDEKPKPVKMPVAKPVVVKPPKPEPGVIPPPVVKPEPVVIKPIPPVVKPVKPVPPLVVSPKGRKISINYFGETLVFYYDPKLQSRLPSKLDENAVSGFWSNLSKADYDPLLDQLSKQRKAYKLNDWANAVMVHIVAQKIFPGLKNEQALMAWFLLAKSGFNTRIAYNDYNVYLLIPSRQQLYSMPYFTFNKVRYYAVRFDGGNQKLGQVYTYDGDYPDANKKLDMRITEDFIAGSKASSRTLSFDFEGKKYNIKISYGKNRVGFFKTYPQMDLEHYFDSKVNSSTATPLQKQLAAQMKGMSELQAVNYLLRFVQTSLRYKTDEGQFGEENYLFPEETLYYPYSDCEDRSVLFAWLVKSLLGLDVIGLDFPGHVATAVHFNDSVTGDAINYKGKRYVVTDPTYINATAGMTMPNYKGNRPGVIRIQ